MIEVDVIDIPTEKRLIEVMNSSRLVELQAENRTIELESFPMTLLASKQHTVGDTRRWTVRYKRWLDNTVGIKTITAVSSSTTCTIGTPAPVILGQDVQFYLTGGALNETLTVTLTMTDTIGNVKNDTLVFTVVAP